MITYCGELSIFVLVGSLNYYNHLYECSHTAFTKALIVMERIKETFAMTIYPLPPPQLNHFYFYLLPSLIFYLLPSLILYLLPSLSFTSSPA